MPGTSPMEGFLRVAQGIRAPVQRLALVGGCVLVIATATATANAATATATGTAAGCYCFFCRLP